DPEAGYGGFSQIIVPTDRPGLSYQLLDKIGNKGSDTGLFFFEDVRVPFANTIGDPHRGFQQQMNQFQDERMVPIVMAPVVSRQVWEATLKHSQERVVFGKPLAKMQVNQHKFVDMMIQITAAEEFAHRCIRKVVRGELRAHLAAANAAADVRAVVLTGAGPAFCAGADLKAGGIGAADNPFVEVLKTVWEFPKPIVGRINGHAFGGGVGLAAACDLTV